MLGCSLCKWLHIVVQNAFVRYTLKMCPSLQYWLLHWTVGDVRAITSQEIDHSSEGLFCWINYDDVFITEFLVPPFNIGGCYGDHLAKYLMERRFLFEVQFSWPISGLHILILSILVLFFICFHTINSHFIR